METKKAKLKNAEQIDQINRRCIFEGYNVVSVRQIFESVNERNHTDHQKIKFHILGVRRKCQLWPMKITGNYWLVEA